MTLSATALAIAALAFAITGPARGESIPKYFTGMLTMSCVPMDIDPHDTDRILWTEVKAKFANWELTDIGVEHHGASGKVYSRAEQYTYHPGDVFGRPKGETDATWAVMLHHATDKRHTMFLGLHDDKYGSWHCVEKHFYRGSKKKPSLVDEVCHDATFDADATNDAS